VAHYVFRVRFRVEPTDPDVSLAPDTFETVLRKRAATPGEDDWLFFRDNLWHGEVNDERHLRETASETLGVEVDAVSFSELVCEEAYLLAFREAIAEHLDLFRADDATDVLSKYLGSSLRVESEE
jgi:hypothetical protein